MSITSFVGPFPTDFALPSDCDNISSNSLAGYDFKSSCLPDDFNPDTTAYYSPGTACPSGYTAQEDCTRTQGAQTTVTCCPSRGDIDLWCVDDPGSLRGPWVSMQCTWSAGDQETVLLVTSDSTTMGVTMSGGQGINAYGLRMVYESSDLETSTSTSTSTSKPTDTTEPTTADDATVGPSETATGESSTTIPSMAPTGEQENDGLSQGAIAAIGVVIPVVLIALGIGLFFFLRRRKQQASANAAIANHESKYPDQSGNGSSTGIASYGSPHSGAGATVHSSRFAGGATGQNHPLSGNPTTHNPQSGELYGDNAHSPYHTAPPQQFPQEMPADSYVFELPASSPPPPPSKSPSFNVAVGATPSPLSEHGKSGYFHRGEKGQRLDTSVKGVGLEDSNW